MVHTHTLNSNSYFNLKHNNFYIPFLSVDFRSPYWHIFLLLNAFSMHTLSVYVTSRNIKFHYFNFHSVWLHSERKRNIERSYSQRKRLLRFLVCLWWGYSIDSPLHLRIQHWQSFIFIQAMSSPAPNNSYLQLHWLICA